MWISTAALKSHNPFCLSPFKYWLRPGMINEKIPYFSELVHCPQILCTLVCMFNYIYFAANYFNTFGSFKLNCLFILLVNGHGNIYHILK